MIPTGLPRPKRLLLIQKCQRTPSKRSIEQKFQGKMRPFEIYRIPLEAPKYRLANGRTQAMQEEFLAINPEKPDNFFTRDAESDQAQLAQHGLLKTVISEEGLLSHFKANDQTEPLILTHDGFVVNGNRRLCAMRELFQGDKKKFARFEHIDVIILPDCLPKDIDSLEADLQIKKDIKAEYSWITKACMLRRKRDLGYADNELTRMYGIPTKDIQEGITLLSDADAYLASIGKAKQYHLIEGDEFAFLKLREGRTKLKDEAEKAIFTQVSYGLIERKDAVPGRLYKVIPEVREHLPALIQKFRTELTIEKAPRKSPGNSKLNLLGGTASPLSDIVVAVSSPGNRAELVSVVRDVIEFERIRSKQRVQADTAIESVRRAHALLNDAINGLNSKSTTAGIADQLDGIQLTISKLRKLLK